MQKKIIIVSFKKIWCFEEKKMLKTYDSELYINIFIFYFQTVGDYQRKLINFDKDNLEKYRQNT